MLKRCPLSTKLHSRNASLPMAPAFLLSSVVLMAWCHGLQCFGGYLLSSCIHFISMCKWILNAHQRLQNHERPQIACFNNKKQGDKTRVWVTRREAAPPKKTAVDKSLADLETGWQREHPRQITKGLGNMASAARGCLERRLKTG